MGVRIVGIWRMVDSLTDRALLTTTKDLEDVALIQVDSDTTPYLRVGTIAATEHIQSLTQRIHTLLVKNHTRTALQDLKAFVVFIQLGFALVANFYLIEYRLFTCSVDKSGIQVDDHITIYVATAIATTIDITALETALQVVGSSVTRCCRRRQCTLCIVNPGVPLQTFRMVRLVNPALGLHLQTFEVQYHLIAVSIRLTQQAT